MPGQQLVQMPDGKLHVLNNSQAITTLAQTGTTTQVILFFKCCNKILKIYKMN